MRRMMLGILFAGLLLVPLHAAPQGKPVRVTQMTIELKHWENSPKNQLANCSITLSKPPSTKDEAREIVTKALEFCATVEKKRDISGMISIGDDNLPESVRIPMLFYKQADKSIGEAGKK